ncbi:hypothetical protein BBO99_00007883 [Phytophthora kernoviae]|uniref:Glycoside hydrolase 123 catalytic domain-containing protein n=2 Tax=Phytophthora kernoviae TaxID=325452 RepID=A0A421FIS3_9STRA|nr:hypothetical protein G195_008806 [Phytophthora kernoviae 00238/432]KAG2507393.1 hypothetical protein JM16_008977 [Phytophthora kernoviae]KAG2510940.1 hypothetical protein JM18_008763 [Phytophthora kernoviae]RLN45405.1 hypothetical protein BBI17_007820 [Phytophthora kernoviae]RLN76018.1 hypothetical protein BBO99_00007883 [Phytophthora kernoviae]
MESGNTAGDESPRARQQSEDFQRHNSGLDERIRSGSGSFATPDAADDGDASMSNDESMSSSSSLEIEETPDLERDQQLERQQNAGHDGRSNSFDDFARQLPYQDAADPPRTGNFSFDVVDTSLDLVMETLERRGVSSRAAREHAVYLRIRIGEHLDPGVYELPLRVFTQDAGFRDEQLTWSSSFAVRVVDFYAHCVALEIADRVRICADEPRDVAVFHEQLRFMQRLAPNFRIKLAVNHPEFFSQAYTPPQVADYVPLLPLACSDLEVTRRLANDARARGGHVCWYVCCGPAFPNQFVSSPLVEGELVGYLTFFFELDGFLRWNYCLWPNQPWDDLRWRAPMWKVGDMYFVLPGLDGWPVETLRLESLRFAGQAFELLALAQEALAPAHMQQLQRTVAEQILRSSDFEEFGRCADRAREDLYSLDPLDYQRAKTIILDTLAASAAKSNAA